MIIYNFFLFFSLKDYSYLYFALFISSLGFLFGLLKGIDMHLIFPQAEPFTQYIPTVCSLSGVFIILFTSAFLNTRYKTPGLHIWLWALIALYGIIISINLAGVNHLSFLLFLYNSIFVLFFIFFVALKSWRGGYEPSKYFILAWSVFVVGFVLFLLRDSRLIAVNTIIGHVAQITSTLTVLFLSFALSKKINIYIEKRNEAQELALATALENEKLVTNQNQLLEARVQQRTSDLEQSIATLSRQSKDLHEANVFKNKVFSIISHDLKSPISTLAGLLKLMKIKSLDEMERTKVVESLEIALKSTKILLDNILAWANKDDGKTEEMGEIDLCATVYEVLDLFRFQAEQKGILLINEIARGFHITANKNMLQLVLRNLVSNAIKFTPKNGQVCISMEQDYLDLLLTIKDTGIGMDKETSMGLFKTNRHTSTRGTENEKGTGLGLLLCKEFVDKYNGTLSVESQPGKGTSFTVRLPQAIPVLEIVMDNPHKK
ncbi:MAG: GHKL domain-containing protein [Cyclobacteriaceae bacterium]|nr:GHKL domain-containing protein [Cyclobacteriaceae bacterium]